MWFFVGFFLLIGLVAGALFFDSLERDGQERRREAQVRALALTDIDRMDGITFEHYVSRLLRHQGYSASVTPASNDFGVDIIASRIGERYAVQVKRQEGKVSRRAISDAVAGKSHYACEQAMVVSNSTFSKGARELAKSTRCILVDREELAKWILSFQQSAQAISEDCNHELQAQPPVIEFPVEAVTADRIHKPAATGMSSGDLHDESLIPISVMEMIEQQAAEEWPDDYTMQLEQIDEERAAYFQIRRYQAPTSVPPEVLQGIFQNAQEEWPSHFSMQYEDILNQVSAYAKLQARKMRDIVVQRTIK